MDPLHIYGDLLCKDPKFVKLERPKLQPPTYSYETNNVINNIAQVSSQILTTCI